MWTVGHIALFPTKNIQFKLFLMSWTLKLWQDIYIIMMLSTEDSTNQYKTIVNAHNT